MPTYQYKAKNTAGHSVKGRMDARSEKELYDKLRQEGVTVYATTQKEADERPYTMKPRELSEFARQMSSMLSAGISVVKAVSILRERDGGKKARGVYDKMYDNIQAGNPLSSAMQQCDGAFPQLMINMFKAGELGGSLDKTTLRAAQYYEKEHKLQANVRNAMTYPIILFVVTIAVTVFIFTVILPQFSEMFGDMEMPFMTKLMMGISGVLTEHWLYVTIGALTLWAIGIRVLKIPSVVMMMDRKKMKIPVIGKLLVIIYTARFARTLSILYSSGLSMVESVDSSAAVMGNAYVQSRFSDVTRHIREGKTLSEAVGMVKDLLEPKLVSAIVIGEETGKLDDILITVADGFDYDAEMATAKLLTLIEPIMIVIMALLIGTVMISVIVPMLTMYSNI